MEALRLWGRKTCRGWSGLSPSRWFGRMACGMRSPGRRRTRHSALGTTRSTAGVLGADQAERRPWRRFASGGGKLAAGGAACPQDAGLGAWLAGCDRLADGARAIARWGQRAPPREFWGQIRLNVDHGGASPLGAENLPRVERLVPKTLVWAHGLRDASAWPTAHA